MEKIFELDQINELVLELLNQFGHYKVWLLEGELGAGKTTLTQAIGKFLRVSDEVSSPTFSLVNEYQSESMGTIYHMDLYRIKSMEEALEIGLFEMVESGYFCIIEWASVIDFRPAVPFIRIYLEHQQNTLRRLSVSVHEN